MERTFQTRDSRWGNKNIKGIRVADPNHIPYNKKPYQADHIGVIEVDTNCVGKWLSIHVEETKVGGATRTISNTFFKNEEEIRALRDLCNFALGE